MPGKSRVKPAKTESQVFERKFDLKQVFVLSGTLSVIIVLYSFR